MQEHRLIEKVLDALDAYANAVTQGATADPADLARFVTFIREFADARHHGKEEDILFAAMAENGFSKDVGPIAVMLQEHALGRAHVSELDAVAHRSSWSEEERRRLSVAADGYTTLLRGHIQKEDNILYPAAAANLPDKALQQVEERCARFEDEHTRSGDGARLEALAQELISKYTGYPPQ